MKRSFRIWLAAWLHTHRSEPPLFRTLRAGRVPDAPRANIIYQIGDEDCVWAAAFLCPCSCGEMIHLSLVRDARPSWRIQVQKNGEVTMLPSVWRMAGCRSHFIIYRSRIVWCMSDSPEVDGWRW